MIAGPALSRRAGGALLQMGPRRHPERQEEQRREGPRLRRRGGISSSLSLSLSLSPSLSLYIYIYV